MSSLKNIRAVSDYNDWAGKRVLLRVDFNVPLDDSGVVTDDFRIRKARPTLDYLRERGARVVLVSHLKHEGKPVSLDSVSRYLADEVPHTFISEYPGAEAERIMEGMNDGDVVMLENLRLTEGEIENSAVYAQALSACADMYVDDAFAVAHREHASVVGVPQLLPSCAGLLMVDEVVNLARVFDPPRPFVFVLGGAKFETKIPLIQKFLGKADTVFVGGALANDVLQAKGYEVGTSKVSDVGFNIDDLLSDGSFVVPDDVIVETADGERVVRTSDAVGEGETIWDIGPESMEELVERVVDAQFVLWNGPLGYYEGGYTDATYTMARAIARSQGESILGGGDTLAAIKELGVLDRFSFVSTGGGAMLDFLANETLPGIEALRRK